MKPLTYSTPTHERSIADTMIEMANGSTISLVDTAGGELRGMDYAPMLSITTWQPPTEEERKLAKLLREWNPRR